MTSLSFKPLSALRGLQSVGDSHGQRTCKQEISPKPGSIRKERNRADDTKCAEIQFQARQGRLRELPNPVEQAGNACAWALVAEHIGIFRRDERIMRAPNTQNGGANTGQRGAQAWKIDRPRKCRCCSRKWGPNL